MRFVCQHCQRYQDDGTGDVTPTHGICAKCLFASYTEQEWMSDPGAVVEIEDAVRERPEEHLLGDFKKDFPDECYVGFDELVGRVLGVDKREVPSPGLEKRL